MTVQVGWRERPGGWSITSAVIALLLLVSAAIPLRAQFRMIVYPPDLSAYPRIDIPFEIQDNTGAVKNLQKDDFTVFENSVHQLPIELVCDGDIASSISFMFIMDVSLSMALKEGGGQQIVDPDSVKWRRAKQMFIDAYGMLRPGDQAALMSFSDTVGLEQPFTTDYDRLVSATYGLKIDYGTAIYAAIIEGTQWLDSQTGRKVIILLTDGVDNRPMFTREQAIATAWNKNIPVFCIGLGYNRTPDPTRNDIDTLRRIAEGTGAKAFLAPSSEDLQGIFDEIFESIYSTGCILSYTSADTCHDGRLRGIEIDASISGIALRQWTSYRLDDMRSRLEARVVLPPPLADEASHTIEVKGQGEIRGLEPVTMTVRVEFETEHITITGVDTDGSIFQGSTMDVQYVAPGIIMLRLVDAIPVRPVTYDIPLDNLEALFFLNIDVLHHEGVDQTSLRVIIESMSQNCEMIPAGTQVIIDIDGCPAEVVIGLDSTTVVRSGRPLSMPLMLLAPVDLLQPMQYSLLLGYDEEFLVYDGFDIEGTVSEKLSVSVLPTAPGRLFITAAPGPPAKVIGDLIVLKFTATQQRLSHKIEFQLEEGSFAQSCIPELQLLGNGLFLDGECSPLLLRRRFSLGRNAPNPVTGGSSVTRIPFRCESTEHVTVEILDSFGRVVEVLVDEVLSSGQHIVNFSPAGLPGGMYFYRLRGGGEQILQKLMWTP